MQRKISTLSVTSVRLQLCHRALNARADLDRGDLSEALFFHTYLLSLGVTLDLEFKDLCLANVYLLKNLAKKGGILRT